MWGLSGAVVSGAGGYWYLSYVYLSWDIMVRRPKLLHQHVPGRARSHVRVALAGGGLANTLGV